MAGRPKGLPKTGGRALGTPNKITTELREMTQEALRRLGGIAYLVSLGKDHPAVFGALLRRCMPQAVEVGADDELTTVVLKFAGGRYGDEEGFKEILGSEHSTHDD